MNPTAFYPAPGSMTWFTPLLCCSLGLLLALPTLALTTPRRWWRQATMANGVLLLAVSMACSWLVLQAAQSWRQDAQTGQAQLSASGAISTAAAAPAAPRPALMEEAGAGWFFTRQSLHLRNAPATSAARIATLPPGVSVWRSGKREGDWWQICYLQPGTQSAQKGWASSLWLRRPDEAQARRTPQAAGACEAR